ncbi:MAG TPA: hypothetical protein VHR45_20440 [Thermoanaerobaculia bacterium]|nr:hypothetical protein [Thermoanaerobaculia bacterium]
MSAAIRASASLRVISLLPTILFAGCIRVGDLSHSAMQYNEAVEEAQNRMLLLNVVRAKLFRPMYITDLSKVTGSIKLDLNSGGIETDFGPYTSSLTTGKKFLTNGKLIPSVDYVHNPTFDVNVLSGQDFEKGFLSPATKGLLAYYWEQGWPQEFLLYLFVHHVRVRNTQELLLHLFAHPVLVKTYKIDYYENYPEPELKKLEAFGRWVTSFVSTAPQFVPKAVNIGPCLGANKVSGLKDLVTATKEGLSIAKFDDGNYQLQKPMPDLILMSHARAEEKAEQKSSSSCDPSAADRKAGSKPSPEGASGQATGTPEAGREVAVESEAGNATLYLRSPEEMLFYLGELMRVIETSTKVPAVCIGGRLWPLFVAFDRHGDQSCNSFVDITYERKEFIIPDRQELPADLAAPFECPDIAIRTTTFPQESAKEASDSKDTKNMPNALTTRWPRIPSPVTLTRSTIRSWLRLPWKPQEGQHKYFDRLEELKCWGGMSTESFSLLTQLIALQKSAKDAPTTSVIRAIAQ